MLKYIVPEPKTDNEKSEVAISSYCERTYIKVSKAMVDAVELGQTVKITLEGEVVSLESRENQDKETNEIALEVKTVSMEEGATALTSLLEDDADEE